MNYTHIYIYIYIYICVCVSTRCDKKNLRSRTPSQVFTDLGGFGECLEQCNQKSPISKQKRYRPFRFHVSFATAMSAFEAMPLHQRNRGTLVLVNTQIVDAKIWS